MIRDLLRDLNDSLHVDVIIKDIGMMFKPMVWIDDEDYYKRWR